MRSSIAVLIVLGWVLIACLLESCGDRWSTPYCTRTGSIEIAIVDGEPSVDRRSTAFVHGDKYACSATVIGPHTVLTAAHCAVVTDILVEDVAWFDVVERLEHPSYSFPFNDLQLLYTEEVLPEPYARIAHEDIECTHTIAQGYGYGSDGALHEREVFEHWHAGDQLFFAEGIAHGDSGGPLWAMTAEGPVLLGVTSWGWGEAPDYEGDTGFISVPYHHVWIEENLR